MAPRRPWWRKRRRWRRPPAASTSLVGLVLLLGLAAAGPLAYGMCAHTHITRPMNRSIDKFNRTTTHHPMVAWQRWLPPRTAAAPTAARFVGPPAPRSPTASTPPPTTYAAAAASTTNDRNDDESPWSRFDGYGEVLRRCSPLAGAPPLGVVEAARAMARCVCVLDWIGELWGEGDLSIDAQDPIDPHHTHTRSGWLP